jgi:hypothetical protein
MTCEECVEVLLDSQKCASGKNGMPGLSVLNLAKQHTENCPACGAKVSEISGMNAVLDQLRLSTVHVEVPPTIEASLLVEYRQRRASYDPSVSNIFSSRLIWGLAVALMLVASLVSYSVVRARSSTKAQANKTVLPTQQPPSPIDSNVSVNRSKIVNHRDADRPELASSKRPLRPKRSHERALAQFSAHGSDELSLNGGGNIIRVTLPLASLVAMGVPMYPEASDRRVTADVARDPFGAVIAIHLVETMPSAN